MRRPIDSLPPQPEEDPGAHGPDCPPVPKDEDLEGQPIIGQEDPAESDAPLPPQAEPFDHAPELDGAPRRSANAAQIQHMKAPRGAGRLAITQDIAAKAETDQPATTQDQGEPATEVQAAPAEVVTLDTSSVEPAQILSSVAAYLCASEGTSGAASDDKGEPEESTAEPITDSAPAEPEKPGADDDAAKTQPHPAEATTDQPQTDLPAEKAEDRPPESPKDTPKPPEPKPEKAQSGPADAREKIVRGPITVFLLNEHSPASGTEVARQLREEGCDIVALELPGEAADEVDREAVEEFYTFLVSKQGSDIRNQPDHPFAAMAAAIKPGHFRSALLDGLRNSNKQIAILDVARDHPRYADLGRMEAATERASQAALGLTRHEFLRPLLVRNALCIARANEAREEVMAEQLRDLKQRYPNKKIGVVTGRGHDQLQGMVSGDMRTKATYVDSSGRLANHGQPALILMAQQMQRGATPSKELVDRTLLEANVDVANILTQKKFELKNTAAYVAGLSDQEVTAKLAGFDEIRTSVGSNYEEFRLRFIKFALTELAVSPKPL